MANLHWTKTRMEDGTWSIKSQTGLVLADHITTSIEAELLLTAAPLDIAELQMWVEADSTPCPPDIAAEIAQAFGQDELTWTLATA